MTTAQYQDWARARNEEAVRRMIAAGGDPGTLTVADGVMRMALRA